MRVVGKVVGVVALAAIVAGGAAVGAPASVADAPSGSEDSVSIVAADPDAAGTEAERRVAAMSVEQKAASVVMGHIPTTDPTALRAYMESSGIGGFILMGANVPATESELRAVTAALTLDPALPPLIGIDEEGGEVVRLPWDGFPGADALKSQPAAATADAFAGRGALVARAGIGVNFGVVADVEDSPSSFIYGRALGTSPEESAQRVAEAVQAERPSVLATLKHFPGHGAPEGDSHASLPESGIAFDEWATTHAVPFRSGVDAGADLLMFGHLRFPAIDPAPASVSAEWHRIARDELGFGGVTITDDLGMLQASGMPEYQEPVANAVSALAAGNDMVLVVMFSTPETAPQIVAGIVAAVADGTLPMARLDEAAARVTRLRLALAGATLMPCVDCAPVG